MDAKELMLYTGAVSSFALVIGFVMLPLSLIAGPTVTLPVGVVIGLAFGTWLMIRR